MGRNLFQRRAVVYCQGDFSAIRCREFGLRRPLEMTYIGKAFSIALIASLISILSREAPTLPKYPTLSTRAKINVVSIALTTSDFSILSRANADVTEIPDVKYAS